MWLLWFYRVPNFGFGYFSDVYEVPDQEVGCRCSGKHKYFLKVHLYVEFIVVPFYGIFTGEVNISSSKQVSLRMS